MIYFWFGLLHDCSLIQNCINKICLTFLLQLVHSGATCTLITALESLVLPVAVVSAACQTMHGCSYRDPIGNCWKCMIKVRTLLWVQSIIPWLVYILLELSRKLPQSVMFKPSACWCHYIEALQIHSYIISLIYYIFNAAAIQWCIGVYSINASIHIP